MFPLFITHDEYFVRYGGSGGGYYDVFELSSYKHLVDGGRAAAARRQQHGSGGQRGSGVGSPAVVAAERWQRGSSSAAMAVWRWW
jgi:hypothetical protein